MQLRIWFPTLSYTQFLLSISMEGTQGGATHLPEATPSQALTAKSPDKSKRDEWSEGGVLCLLDVYESKWILRNRAKLKGSDWEDIAHQVSVQFSGTKTLKTANQCKNKIESLKKRYRAEAAACNPSRSCSPWQYYARMDSLLKGTLKAVALPKAEAVLEVKGQLQCSNHDDGSNTMPMDLNANNDDNSEEKKESRGTDSNTSADKPGKRRKGLESEVAESIRLFAHSIIKIEEVRMEMYKESERIRAEAEIKKGEMELKRTEIVAKTQLQIAKLFAKRSQRSRDKGGNSSLGDELNSVLPSEGMED